MAELCSRRTTLELRGLAQEEHVTPQNSAKNGAKSSQGKKKKESDYYEEISSEEEDYLKPADSSLKKKAYKASKGSQKKKKSFREVFTLTKDDDKLKPVDKKKKSSSIRQTASNETCGNVCNNKSGKQDQTPDVFQGLSSEKTPERTFPEEVLIMSSGGEFSSFNLFVSKYVLFWFDSNSSFLYLCLSDGNNNDESGGKKKPGVKVEGGSKDGGMKKLGLKKGTGGQSKLFFV